MRYIDPKGTEGSANSITEYLAAVKAGRISPDSLVFDEESKKWVRADTTSEFRSMNAGNVIDGVKEEKNRLRYLKVAGWILFLAPLPLGIFSTAPGMVGYRWGLSIGVVLIVALVTMAALAKSTRLVKESAFVLVMTGFFAYHLWGLYTDWSSAKDAERAQIAIKDALVKIDEMKVEPSRRHTLSSAAAVQPSRSGQGLAGVVALLPKYRELALKLRVELDSNISALELDQALTPQRLVTATGIEISRDSFDRYELIANAHRAANHSLQDAFRAEAAIAHSDATFFEKFDESVRQQKSLWDDWLLIQQNSLREMRQVLSIASRNLGRTSVANGKILFSDESELSAYRAPFAKINTLAQEEAALIKRAADAEDKVNKEWRNLAAR